jgi:hypothetical protein
MVAWMTFSQSDRRKIEKLLMNFLCRGVAVFKRDQIRDRKATGHPEVCWFSGKGTSGVAR